MGVEQQRLKHWEVPVKSRGAHAQAVVQRERLCRDTCPELADRQGHQQWLGFLRFSCNHPHRTRLLDSKVKAHLAAEPSNLELVPRGPHTDTRSAGIL